MTAPPYPYLIFYEATETEIIIHAVRHARADLPGCRALPKAGRELRRDRQRRILSLTSSSHVLVRHGRPRPARAGTSHQPPSASLHPSHARRRSPPPDAQPADPTEDPASRASPRKKRSPPKCVVARSAPSSSTSAATSASGPATRPGVLGRTQPRHHRIWRQPRRLPRQPAHAAVRLRLRRRSDRADPRGPRHRHDFRRSPPVRPEADPNTR